MSLRTRFSRLVELIPAKEGATRLSAKLLLPGIEFATIWRMFRRAGGRSLPPISPLVSGVSPLLELKLGKLSELGGVAISCRKTDG